MENKINEKRIYELLGVNLFRKYVLNSYQKILNGLFFITGITKFFGIRDIYIMNDFSTEGLKKYKKWSKVYAVEHVCSFLLMSAMLGLPDLSILLTCSILFVMITDIYAIMTQRYHHIRINDILEKREKLQKKLEERTSDEEKIKSMLLQSKSQDIISITLAKEKPLSLEERRKELENFREFVSTENIMDHSDEYSTYPEKERKKIR